MNGKIVVLEGLPAVGKTTIGVALSKYSDKIMFLRDLSSRVIYSQKFIMSNWLHIIGYIVAKLIDMLKCLSNVSQLRIVADLFFLYYDIEREKFVRKLMLEKDLHIVMERNHTTTLAYAYGASRIANRKNKTINIYYYIFNILRRLFVKPNMYIILVCQDSVRLQRLRSRGGQVYPIWDDDNFIRHFYNFFEYYIGVYETGTAIYVLDTTFAPPEKIVKYIYMLIVKDKNYLHKNKVSYDYAR